MKGLHLLATAWLGGIVALSVLPECGLRINTSESVAPGIYRVLAEPARIGQLAIVCPPATEVVREAADRGYLRAGDCATGLAPLLKRVAAGPGDRVEVTALGVWVNGVLVPDTMPQPADPQGRPLPNLIGSSWTLGAGQLLLLSDRYPDGFDARYFGPLQARGLRAVPLLRFGGQAPRRSVQAYVSRD